MTLLRPLACAGVLSVMLPAVSVAQSPWRGAGPLPYELGFERGERAGAADARRGDRFDFADESDYRRGDAGYRNQYGSRDRFRSQFRSGFEAGYRRGYRPVGPGPWRFDNGRFYGGTDPAFARGYNDGYEAGLKDARRHDWRDPISESRYRNGDHGYSRSYGSRDAYKARYRLAFRQGYDRGYADARRY